MYGGKAHQRKDYLTIPRFGMAREFSGIQPDSRYCSTSSRPSPKAAPRHPIKLSPLNGLLRKSTAPACKNVRADPVFWMGSDKDDRKAMSLLNEVVLELHPT